MPRPTVPRPLWQRSRLAAGSVMLALLAACGGGDDGSGNSGVGLPATCSVADKNVWLRSLFGEWYFWYRLSPSPDPAAYASTEAYFDALLYAGSDPAFPADRWSNFESTESFNRFYGDAQTLGWGVSVAGLEVTGMPNEPLYVRHIEPHSPAGLAGVQRGEQVLEINGRSSADVIADPDGFDILTADTAGQALTLKLRSAGIDRTLTLNAAVFGLTPVPPAKLITTPGSRKVGWVQVNQMINQATPALDAALASFMAAGASELVLDLRYNGGGLVSVANTIAGYVAGNNGAGRIFTSLLFNDRRAAVNNQVYRLANPAAAMHLRRVTLLTGRRTCSATEQLINGLRGIGVEVVAIGETTCGKPVGFLPQSDGCGTTYSAVNFESVNERNEGRYFDGFDATCEVAEDWSKPLGDETEPLLAAALQHVDTGVCPPVAARERPLQRRDPRDRRVEPGERQAMIP